MRYKMIFTLCNRPDKDMLFAILTKKKKEKRKKYNKQNVNNRNLIKTSKYLIMKII